MEKFVFDKNGDYVIKFEWKEENPVWVDFKSIEAVSTYGEKGEIVEFHNYELGSGIEFPEHKIEDFDTYYSEDNRFFNGFIKWDGCMEIYNLNHHFCGYNDILQRVLFDIYNEARNIMKESFDRGLANFKID